MSKKGKLLRQDEVKQPQANLSGSGISRRGWKVIGFGVLMVTFGFIVLSFTDPRGQNLASTASPLLLIVGYTLIGIGIITKDPV